MARECGATPANPRIIFWYPPAQDFSPPSDPPHINGRKLFFTLSRVSFPSAPFSTIMSPTQPSRLHENRRSYRGAGDSSGVTQLRRYVYIYTHIYSRCSGAVRPKCYSMRQRLLLQVTRSSRPRRWTTTSCESPMASTKFFTLFSVNVHCQIPWG